MPKIPKTVYVLGAGFSTPAGGPDQSSLVEAIFSLPSNNAKTTAAKESLRRFLVDVLQFDWAKKSNIALEDIYTPIDRCLVDGISLRGMPLDDVRTLRGQMEYLISLAIDRAFDIREAKTPGASAYVQHFAEYLVEIASGRAERAKVPTTKAD